MSYPVDIQLLGTVQIRARDTMLVLHGSRKERLLAALALDVSRVVSIDRLIDVVWPVDIDTPATARRQVQDLVSRLRNDLAVAGCPDAAVITHGSGYSLRLPADAVDASRFRNGVATGRALREADPELAAMEFRSALELWRGDALAGLACPPLDADRIGLEELRLVTWEQAIEIELALGRHNDVLSELAVLVELHTARERLVQLYMRALCYAGRTADALSAFHQLRRRLAAELAIDPGPELRQTYESIVRGDLQPLGDHVPRLGSGTRASAPDSAAAGQDIAPDSLGIAASPARVPRELPLDIADFTGRADYVLRLYDLLSAAAEPGGGRGSVPVVVVSGPGGMGKTTLAVHAAHRLSALFPDGQVFVELHGTSPAPIDGGEILARYLRALAVADHEMPADTDRRAAMFRSRVHGRRMLFVLDDADRVAQLQDSLPSSAGCGVLITSRNQLRSLPGSTHINLGPLDADDARSLFGQVAGDHLAEQEPGAVEAMVRMCAGLPLAVRINAAQLAAQPDPSVAALAARLTDERRRLDQMRLEDLSVRSSFKVGYDSVAARPGGEVTVAALRRVCLADGPHFGVGAATALLGRPAADTRRILARLVDASLLQTTTSGRYQLHELVRLFARERAEEQDTKAARAEALHGLLSWQLHSAFNAARAITPGRRHADPAAIPAAGEVVVLDGPESALRWFDVEMPSLVCAVRQAAATGDHEIAWMLATALWDAFTLRGNWTDWIGTHEVALPSTRVLGDRQAEAWICSNLSTAYTRVGRVRDAIDCLMCALEAVREIRKPTAEAALLGNLGNAHQELGQLPQALDLYQQALAIHTSTGQRHGQCLMLLNIAEARHLLGQHDSAARCYRESLALQTGDDHLTGIALAGLGDVSSGQGLPPDIAAGHYLRALEVQHRAGHRPAEADTLERLAAALAAAGKHDDAERYRFEASIVRRDLGHG